MFDCRYSMIGSVFRRTVQAAAERSAGGVGQLERLLDLEVGQTLDLEDAARKMFFLPFFSTVSRPALIA